jgi:hypothetical protein
MTEKEVQAGQSNIRLGFVIAPPVHHDGSEALVKWALVERLIGLALGAHEVNAGGQSLRAHCERGAGIVQLAAQLSPLGHDAFPREVEARARWRAQRGAVRTRNGS